MKFLLMGVNHKSAPVEVRERLAVSEARLPEATPVAITLVQRPVDGLVWDVGVIGEKGGRIDVLYTPAGVFLGPVADQ